MRKTSVLNKLNHKPQGVCEENKEKSIRRKKRLPVKNFAVKRSTLEACRRTVTQPIAMIFVTRILHSIKVLVL